MEYIQVSDKLKMSKIALGFWRLKSWKMSKEELLKYLEEAIDLSNEIASELESNNSFFLSK